MPLDLSKLNKKRKIFFLFLLGGIFVLIFFISPPLDSQSATASFKVIINNNSEQTSSRQVVLTLKAGTDTKIMALSNTSDFKYSVIGPYQSSKQWTLSSGEGVKQVYAKFYVQGSGFSGVVSDSIVYKKAIPVAPVTPVVSSDSSSCLNFSFNNNLYLGLSKQDVQCLKVFLNKDPDTALSATGQGSAGRETIYFGPLTKKAVIKFQNKYRNEISQIAGYAIKASGFVGPGTRAQLNALSSKTPASYVPPVPPANVIPSATPVPPVPECGNGLCDGTETCSTCSEDCGGCPIVCGDGSCNGTENYLTCSQDCREDDFIFTFWPMSISKSYNSILMDEMMATGMTYAGAVIRPSTISDKSIFDLKSKGYKIALEISSGHYSSGGPEELLTGIDDSKFLNAPSLDKSKCENWNSKYAIDPSYTGILWQNTLDNTYNVTKAVSPDLVLFDVEIWSNPSTVEYKFNKEDIGNDCNFKIIEQGIGYDAYFLNWKNRGIELKNTVKRASPSVLTSFYNEIPENGKRWIQAYNGNYAFNSVGYMPNGTGDFLSPSLYVLPNLEVLEKNIQDMNFSDLVPWISFTYYYGYSNYGGGNVYFDPSVSREAGRMFRKAGAKGFIVYPNATSFNAENYWMNHSREMIMGFLEGNNYIEKNKIRNNGFEAFKTKTKKYSYQPDGSLYLVGETQFSPVFWNWEDTNTTYEKDEVFENLVKDKQSGAYSWRHSRMGDAGSRTILSQNFTVKQEESGDYNFSIWNKTNIDSKNGKLKFYIIDLTNNEQNIGEINFQNSWNKFEGKINLIEGNYKLKIVIEDSTGQKIDVLFDGVDLEKK